MHIPIGSNLDFSIGEMSQNEKTTTQEPGDTKEIQDHLVPKNLSYSSNWRKC